MKIQKKNIYLTVSILILFVFYSVGVSFSIHDCEHCGEKRPYFILHPDCCPASAWEHHHANQDCEHIHFHEEDSCEGHCSLEDADHFEHKHMCCDSEVKYYKIATQYTFTETFKATNDISLFAIPILIQEYIYKSVALAEVENKAPPHPPLSCSQGGELFLFFTHQQVFYA